jgi:hypothetical protein
MQNVGEMDVNIKEKVNRKRKSSGNRTERTETDDTLTNRSTSAGCIKEDTDPKIFFRPVTTLPPE